MSIPEEMIMGHLDFLLTSSEPGSILHHLTVVSAPAGAVGPLGLVDEGQLEAAVYAIAPVGDVDPERFTAQVIVGAGVDHEVKRRVVLFAGLSQEKWSVATAKADDLARRLGAEGRLDEHPAAVEVTVVYGACRDGRRWRGLRTLTGPEAGRTSGVELLVGRLDGQEAAGMAPLVRRLVGQRR